MGTRPTAAASSTLGLCLAVAAAGSDPLPTGDGPCAGDTQDGKACVECHGELLRAPFVHGPVAVEQCRVCHDPGLADDANEFGLVATGPELCLRCHVEIRSALSASARHHQPVDTDCGQCHDPHSGTDQYRLRQPVPQLCYQCHPEKGHAGDQEFHFHGAVLAERSCLGCHNQHGSALPNVLRDRYPGLPYVSFDRTAYALCLRCHDPALVLEDRTQATGFRDGDRNLHFVHVNRADKGRTCRICHDVHGSRLPKNLNTSVPFGRWFLPLQYSAAATGGSCAPGCHVQRSYDRNRPPDDVVTADAPH